MNLSTRFLLVLSGGLLAGQLALGATANGNEFALLFSEAKGDVGRKVTLDEALGKQHFFRYLRITEIEEGEENGLPFMTVTTCEPSSKMTVKFRVRKTMSLIVLKQDRTVVETHQPQATSLKMDEHLISGDQPVILYRKMREKLKTMSHEA